MRRLSKCWNRRPISPVAAISLAGPANHARVRATRSMQTVAAIEILSGCESGRAAGSRAFLHRRRTSRSCRHRYSVMLANSKPPAIPAALVDPRRAVAPRNPDVAQNAGRAPPARMDGAIVTKTHRGPPPARWAALLEHDAPLLFAMYWPSSPPARLSDVHPEPRPARQAVAGWLTSRRRPEAMNS